MGKPTNVEDIRAWKSWVVAILIAIVASAALHLVGGAVVWLTPLKEYFFPETPFVQREYDPEQIQGTANDVRRDIAKKLCKRLGTAQDMLITLADMRDRKAKEKVRVMEDLSTPGEKAGMTLNVKGIDSLHNCYMTALKLEAAAYDAYETWRALTLADQQQIPWDQAREVTKLGRPNRRESKKDVLDGAVTTMAGFKAFREEVTFVKNEFDSIVVGVQRMRDLVEGLDSPGIGRDNTAAVQLSGTSYQGAGGIEFGASVGPPLLADEVFPSSQSKLKEANFQPEPGRSVREGGQPMQWMYIDTWYFIGPFPNPQRTNLDKKFPPESVVDLDSIYVGKDDRQLKWRFRRYPSYCIVPFDVTNYAIWYGYTEVWSDEEKEYWFMFGSDDYGKSWVNGKLVWASGKTPHHYIPDRGFKKVKLNKGPNRLMFKIENAGGTMGFSVIMAVQPSGGAGGTPAAASGGAASGGSSS
jgi:hypothetical protein